MRGSVVLCLRAADSASGSSGDLIGCRLPMPHTKGFQSPGLSHSSPKPLKDMVGPPGLEPGTIMSSLNAWFLLMKVQELQTLSGWQSCPFQLDRTASEP